MSGTCGWESVRIQVRSPTLPLVNCETDEKSAGRLQLAHRRAIGRRSVLPVRQHGHDHARSPARSVEVWRAKSAGSYVQERLTQTFSLFLLRRSGRSSVHFGNLGDPGSGSGIGVRVQNRGPGPESGSGAGNRVRGWNLVRELESGPEVGSGGWNRVPGGAGKREISIEISPFKVKGVSLCKKTFCQLSFPDRWRADLEIFAFLSRIFPYLWGKKRAV